MYGKYLPHNNSASGATIHMVWHHTPHYSVWQIPPQGMMCAFVIMDGKYCNSMVWDSEAEPLILNYTMSNASLTSITKKDLSIIPNSQRKWPRIGEADDMAH